MATSRNSPTEGEMATSGENERVAEDASPLVPVNGYVPNTASAEMSETNEPTEIPKMAELKGIRYVGIADVKTLTANDLRSMGVEDPKGDLVWSDQNSKVTPTEEFNAATRDVLLSSPDFVAQ